MGSRGPAGRAGCRKAACQVGRKPYLGETTAGRPVRPDPSPRSPTDSQNQRGSAALRLESGVRERGLSWRHMLMSRLIEWWKKPRPKPEPDPTTTATGQGEAWAQVPAPVTELMIAQTKSGPPLRAGRPPVGLEPDQKQQIIDWIVRGYGMYQAAA